MINAIPKSEKQLKALAKKTTSLSEDPKKVRSEAIVEMADGRKWRCVGRRPKGNLWHDGYIEMIPC